MTINRQNDLSPGNGIRRDIPIGSELQPDPEMQEGPAGAGRIAIYAAAAVVLLGAVFYGLNNGPSQTPNAASTTSAPPAAASADNSSTNSPPIRNVTPNREAGATTGAAPAQTTPPQSNPTGSEVDRSKGATTR